MVLRGGRMREKQDSIMWLAVKCVLVVLILKGIEIAFGVKFPWWVPARTGAFIGITHNA